MTVLEANHRAVDIHVAVHSGRNDELHPRLVAVVSRQVHIHEEFEAVPVLGREARFVGRPGVVARVAGNRQRQRRVVEQKIDPCDDEPLRREERVIREQPVAFRALGVVDLVGDEIAKQSQHQVVDLDVLLEQPREPEQRLEELSRPLTRDLRVVDVGLKS